MTGALDRAVDAAAALEVRGYANSRRLPRQPRVWSRQDFSVSLAAAAILAAVVAAGVAGLGSVAAYPRLEIAGGLPELLVALAIPALALAPFAGRSGRLGVAHA